MAWDKDEDRNIDAWDKLSGKDKWILGNIALRANTINRTYNSSREIYTQFDLHVITVVSIICENSTKLTTRSGIDVGLFLDDVLIHEAVTDKYGIATCQLSIKYESCATYISSRVPGFPSYAQSRTDFEYGRMTDSMHFSIQVHQRSNGAY